MLRKAISVIALVLATATAGLGLLLPTSVQMVCVVAAAAFFAGHFWAGR